MLLKEIIRTGSCLVLPERLSRDELLERMVTALFHSGRCPIPDAQAAVAEILRREAHASTAFGLGVAIPHCFLADVGSPYLAVACSRPGVDFQALDGKPTHVVFLLVEDIAARGRHTTLISRIARLCGQTPLLRRLREARDPEAVAAILAEEDSALD